MSRYFKWAELPARTDVYTHAGTTSWGNHDLYPIPRKERTWGWLAYVGYQIVVGINISNYTLASTYIAIGLTVGQTLGAVLAGCILSSMISYISCRPGLDHAIGFVSNNSCGVWIGYLTGTLDCLDAYYLRSARCVLADLLYVYCWYRIREASSLLRHPFGSNCSNLTNDANDSPVFRLTTEAWHLLSCLARSFPSLPI